VLNKEMPAPALKSVLEVGLDIIHQRIFVADLKRIGNMKRPDYEDYKNETLAPLNGLARNLKEMVVLRGLGSNIYRFETPVKANEMELTDAQIIAYMDARGMSFGGELPPVLKTEGEKTGSFARLILVNSINWPNPCPLPNHPNYNPNSADRKPNERYLNNNNGTITDVCTKLMWEQTPSPDRFGRVPAKEHCDKLVKAGFNDWRLPDRFELESLVDKTLRTGLNGVFGENPGFFLSSSFDGNANDAWGVYFPNGSVTHSNNFGLSLRVRCVR
jgi:hypothetical protein